MFREGWISINAVPTHVLTWGGWIEDKIEGDSVFVCITGNPGMPEYYHTFLQNLQASIKMPVWILNFAGCAIPPKDTNLALPSLKRNPHLYNLDGQVKHKYEFIKKYIPESKTIYISGHSVGAKIVVELMKKEEISNRTKRTYLLFPTLENIATTFNGIFITNLLQYCMSIILFLSWIFATFPVKIRYFLIRCYFRLSSRIEVDEHCMTATVDLVQPKVLRSVFTLALDEMDKIRDLDREDLNRLGKKINCYYNKDDGWAPLAHYENICKECPSVNAVLLEDKYKHAFVLFTPVELAQIISNDLLQDSS